MWKSINILIYLCIIRATKDELKPINKATNAKKPEDIIPFQIQSGFNAPDGLDKVRFGLSFTTTTVTTFSTVTSTSTLTAICNSSTGFPLCGFTGK